MADTCVVVGAGPGIGRACALAFAHEGYDIALIARHAETLTATADEITAQTRRAALALTADAGDSQSLHQALRDAQRQLGPPRVLVYNITSAQRARPTTIDPEQLVREFRINVVGALLCAQWLAPDMRVAGGGTLLFTGGGLADYPSADFASLALCKAALKNLALTLAQDLGPQGIHVATVTVHGVVQEGTHFDPHLIAQSFLKLHRQPRGRFDTELVYR